MTGFTVGPIWHWWYKIADYFIPGSGVRVVVKKVLADQLLFSPVCLTTFLVTLGLLERSSWEKIGRDCWRKGLVLYTAEWFIYPPASFINFYWMPLQYRVLFDNCVAFCVDMFQSTVVYSDALNDDDDDEDD